MNYKNLWKVNHGLQTTFAILSKDRGCAKRVKKGTCKLYSDSYHPCRGCSLQLLIYNNRLYDSALYKKENTIDVPDKTPKTNFNDGADSSYNDSKPSFGNRYGTATTICAHSGCANYIAASGDTNCCMEHSKKCAECGCYIDEDATYCMVCLEIAASNNTNSNSVQNQTKDWMKDQASGKDYSSNDGGEYYCMGKNVPAPIKQKTLMIYTVILAIQMAIMLRDRVFLG
jgi:hypothetical protein